MDLTRLRVHLILSFWIDFRGNPSKKGQISAINYLKAWQHMVCFVFFFKGLRGPNYHYIYANGTRIDFTKILRKVSRAYLSRGRKMSYLGAWNGGK